MRFSILTPSRRQLPWLKRCVRSVADQRGVEVEHLIQDAESGPELAWWVRENSTARLHVEADAGMYDGLNRALERATGEVIGILNCDEQYLPGTLARVARAFREHPQADLVAGDYLIVDATQRLLAYRKVTPLRRAMILTDHLYAFTCALFFRRTVFADGLRFDPALRSIADGELVARALARGHRAALVPEYLATFTWTGTNLSAQQISRAEERHLRAKLPAALRLAAPWLRLWRLGERLWAGGYTSGPVRYEVFVGEEDTARTRMECLRPRFRYPRGA
jgi:glycosyltransferase involved in cell wall biosynthesis